MRNREINQEKLKTQGVIVLTKEEQAKIMGGMQWTGKGSKNVEMDMWTALKAGDPWGARLGIKVSLR